MKILLTLCTLLTFMVFSKAQDLDPREIKSRPGDLFFNYMMIYSYEKTVDGKKEKKEFEFYFNPETQLLMWLPRMEEVNAVISTPEGEIYSFSQTLPDGPRAKLTRFDREKSKRYMEAKQLEQLKDSKKSFDAFDLQCSSYNMVSNAGNMLTTIVVANDFPVQNADQLYALAQDEIFDAHLPAGLDFINILMRNEFLVKSVMKNDQVEEKIELDGITSTFYFFSTSEYEFYTSGPDGISAIANPFLNQ